ncbi:hypothetical protein yfred0001_39830 [Yersinia frederiksenii ATCC 33641]|nr:hypothetical protein yfred0001_39830 [Yersinia frederiksenii ATCC 33641]
MDEYVGGVLSKKRIIFKQNKPTGNNHILIVLNMAFNP